MLHLGNDGLNSAGNKATGIPPNLPFQTSLQEIQIQMTKLESKLLQIHTILIPVERKTQHNSWNTLPAVFASKKQPGQCKYIFPQLKYTGILVISESG